MEEGQEDIKIISVLQKITYKTKCKQKIIRKNWQNEQSEK